MKHFDLDQFDFYLGSYYIGDGDSIWIANAKELSELLDKNEVKL
jgi:hypothetical protein